MSVLAQIKDSTRNIMAGYTRTRNAIVLELHGSTVKDTPRDTGRLAGNWQLMPKFPSLVVFEDARSVGDSTLARARENISKAAAGDPIYLTNNVDYAQHIEYGTPKIKPFAMLRKNVARIQRIVAKRAAEEKRRK